MTSTMDELITDLHEASVFSIIDLRAGYHQLVLHCFCRYTTTFSTHLGLCQYKRLSFGISTAAEVFQHTTQTVLGGIKGVPYWVASRVYRTGWHQGCTVLDGIKGVPYWMASRVYRTGWHQGCTVLDGIKGVPYWVASRVYRTGWLQGCTKHHR